MQKKNRISAQSRGYSKPPFKRGILCILSLLAGCLLPMANIPQQTIIIPTPRQLLRRQNEGKTLRGKLWDRSEFLIQFPLHLLEIGNLIEQTPNVKSDFSPKQASQTLYQKDGRIVREMLQSTDASQRGMGLEMIQEQKSFYAQTRNYMHTALFDNDPYVRMVAVQIVARDNKDHFAFYEKALLDKNEFVRLEAIRALSTLETTKTQPLLFRSLEDSSPLVRGEIVKILAEKAAPESIPYLEKLLRDSEEYVKAEAARALQKFRKANGESYGGNQRDPYPGIAEKKYSGND